LQKDKVPGFYYESELTKAPPPSETGYFFIQKILKKRKIKGEQYYFVKYLFYGDKFNSWVKATDIITESEKTKM